MRHETKKASRWYQTIQQGQDPLTTAQVMFWFKITTNTNDYTQIRDMVDSNNNQDLEILAQRIAAVVQFYLALGHIGQMQAENLRPRSVIQTANLPISSSLFQLQIFNGQTSTNICQPILEHLLKMNKKHIA
jgi:hypothetical protein